MSYRTVSRLRRFLCVALMASLIVQLVGGYDFRGLPFLYFGIAVAVLVVVAILSRLKHKPVERPE
ncbi:MAG: hypothetical protein ABIS51_22515 [Sphingomonas sp.]